MVLLIMLINLRGVRKSGMTFAIPTYFFLIMIFSTVIIGFIRLLTGGLSAMVDAPIVTWRRAPDPQHVPDPARLCQRHHFGHRG